MRTEQGGGGGEREVIMQTHFKYFDQLAHDLADQVGEVIRTLAVLQHYLHQQWNNTGDREEEEERVACIFTQLH